MKFDRNKVKPGDRLLAGKNAIPVIFKGMGHNGGVIITYTGSEGLRDVILLQREVRIPDDAVAA